LNAVIIIVQHVDEEFSSGLAEWLDAQTPLCVRLATRGSHLIPGNVYVAGTNDHLILTSHLTFAYTPEPRELPYRPSVDVLFKSVAKHWPGKGGAILLTGMGRDGAEGLAVLRKTGWHTIAQDETTSVVYGMPKAAKELGAAVEILPLEKIAQAIVMISNKKKSVVVNKIDDTKTNKSFKKMN
jgi:two-component system response regulator WspF